MKNKTKVIAQEVLEDNSIQKTIFKLIMGSLAILLLVYFYFVGSTVFNILAKKTLENNAQTLENEIGQLELSYLEKTREINKDFAFSQGFTDARDSIFASRTITQVAVR